MNNVLLKHNYCYSEVVEEMADKLTMHFCKDVVILNIGTNKHIHDTLAPLVGTLLKKQGFKYPIYGDLKNPVDYSNLDEVVSKIFLRHGENLFIIAIDACYMNGMTGTILLRESPVNPGTAVRSSFTSVGDMAILGVVDSFYKNNPDIKSFDVVSDIAKVISSILMKAQENYFNLLKTYSHV